MYRLDVRKWLLKQGDDYGHEYVGRSRRARLKWNYQKEGGVMKKMIKWAFGILWGFFGLYGLLEWVSDRLFR